MSVIIDALRYISSLIDWGLYSLAGFIYQVFCAIATSTIIETSDVRAFAERIYVVVGVFMLFKVGISMLKYLINPDQLTDNKTGYSKLLWNISTALILLVSIPTIYDYAMKVQTAVLKSNIIAKVVLGKTAGATADFKDAGKSMIYTTLSAFVMPNYEVTDKDGNYVILDASADVRACFNTKADGTINTGSGYTGMFKMKDGAVIGLNSKCDAAFSDMTDDESKDMYISATKNSDIRQLLDVTVDAKLNDEIQEDAGRGGTLAVKLYFLKYMWGISWLIGAFLCFIFATFCIDMGIRSIKLAFLILISPIPVLSMVNPDKGANGMLSEWWKMTLATYLDLFLRIMSIFFVLFVIQQVDLTGTIAEEFGPIVSAFAMVFIIIGALLFAKELPELISKLIPGMGSIMKGGFNPLKKLGAAAAVATSAPLVGKGLTSLSNRFATQHAMNRANRRMEAAKRKDIKNDYKSKMAAINASKSKPEEKQKELDDLKQKQADELKAFDEESKQRLATQRKLNAEEAKYMAAEAASGVSLLGGESKPITAAGIAAAKIKKDSAKKVHDMQMASLKQREAEANLEKVREQAKSERQDEITQKEKQILDVQREQEVQKRMKDLKKKDPNMSDAAARSEAERIMQAEEQKYMQAQAVEQKVQEKLKANPQASAAEVEAEATKIRNEMIAKGKSQAEVNGMSSEEVIKAQAMEQQVQAKMQQGMSKAEATAAVQKEMGDKSAAEIVAMDKARTEAQQEVAGMTTEQLSKEVSASEMYSQLAGERAKKEALAMGKTAAEATEIGITAAKESREKAEDSVVGSLGDRMDAVAEREGVIYNSAEYADQVRITREAKNRRNSIQSSYEKAAREQQLTGNVTLSDGTVKSGQDAIDYVDKLRVDYTKASSDYDFMSKELDGLAEKYPDDHATRKGYENAKDYYDKKEKVSKYASKSSKVSNNESEGAQYTVQELIQEDTVVNRIRRADSSLAQTRSTLVARQGEIQAQQTVLEAQIKDAEVAGNVSETARLRNELNVSQVELGRVNTSIAQADIARTNAVNGYVLEKGKIDNKLQDLQTQYTAIETDIQNMMGSGPEMAGSPEMTRLTNEKAKIEQNIELLTKRSGQVEAELSRLEVNPSEQIVPSTIVKDVRISGIEGFDKVGDPIRVEFKNIVNQMEADVQVAIDPNASIAERTKAKMAIDSALKKLGEERTKYGDALHSGLDAAKTQEFESELNSRISQVLYDLNSQSTDNNNNNNQ